MSDRPDPCQLARADRKHAQRFLASPAPVTAFSDLAPAKYLHDELIRTEGDCRIVWDAYSQRETRTYRDPCRPAVMFAPLMATPGEARAFQNGYEDHPRWIGPDSASYRAGFMFAEKHAEIDRDCDREPERFDDGSGR